MSEIKSRVKGADYYADAFFVCDNCHNEYPKDWSDEEALVETSELYGDNVGDLGVLCDDCYKDFLVWMATC